MTAPTTPAPSTIAGMFTAMFRRRKEETALDLRELVGRKLAGEDVPEEHIIAAAADSGLDGPAVDRLAQRIALRRAHRKMAAERPAIEKELENVQRQIKEAAKEWDDFREAYLAKLHPLELKRQEIQARLGNAIAADSALLETDSLEPDIAERLREAREAVTPLKLRAPKLQAELNGLHEDIARTARELKDAGISIKALGLNDPEKRKEFTAHQLGDKRELFPLVQYHLGTLDKLPAVEREYRDVVAKLEPMQAALVALEQEAWDS